MTSTGCVKPGTERLVAAARCAPTPPGTAPVVSTASATIPTRRVILRITPPLQANHRKSGGIRRSILLLSLKMRFAPEYVSNVLNDNFEDAKVLLLAPLMSIHYAHLVMLTERHIISRDDARTLRHALDGISIDAVKEVEFDPACEDLFFYLERLIAQGAGEQVAGRLHTARSRNDIDMTMYRIRQREFISGMAEATLDAAAGAARAGRAAHPHDLRRAHPHPAGAGLDHRPLPARR